MKASTIKNRVLESKFSYLFIWIIIWKIASLIVNKEVYLPSPMQIFNELTIMFANKNFYVSIGYTVFRAFLAFFISTLVGIILGFAAYFNKYIYKLLIAPLTVIRSTPIPSIIFLIWMLSTASLMPIIVGFLICFPIVFTNVVEGLKSADDNLINMCRIYKIKRWRIIFLVYLPSISTHLIAAMSNSLGLAWKAVATAEVLAQPKFAIGTNIAYAKYNIEVPNLIAWTIVIIVISAIFDKLLYFVSGFLCKWKCS